MEEYGELEEYQDSIEDQQDTQEAYEDALESQKRMGLDYPQPRETESLYNLFHKVLRIEDSSKVGNLDKIELGLSNLSVRACQEIALLAREVGHPKFAAFFEQRGQIVLRTSASKKGWFTELFVSQKKQTAKTSSVFPGGESQEEEKVPFWKKRRKKKWSFGPGEA